MRAVGSGAAAMLACPAASSAAAQPRYETVTQFYRTCVDETKRKVNGRCEAYLAGAAETLSATAAAKPESAAGASDRAS